MKTYKRILRIIKRCGKEPIRVFCIHHVCDEYNSDIMWDIDWVSTASLKRYIIRLKNEGVQFVSLDECKGHLRKDFIRRKKYAVLTADDGFSSMINILPWLDDNNIPITLFLNSKSFKQKEVCMNIIPLIQKYKLSNAGNTDAFDNMYLNSSDISKYHNISIAYHGHEHIDEVDSSRDLFEENLKECIDAFADETRVIPFYAHTYGKSTKENDAILKKYGLTPVYINGGKNYCNGKKIDRELICESHFPCI